MAFNKQFGERLSEGIGSVALKQGARKGEIEQRIADQIGFSLDTVRRWEKGYVPVQPQQVAFLVAYCVKHGHVRLDWASSLLTHANYPHRNALLAEICPDEKLKEALPSPRAINLPSRRELFLGRLSELKWVLDALESSWPVCLIEGMAGVGKTTLALEIAYACAGQSQGVTASVLWPKFAFIVWTSAEPEKSNLTLNDVLDAIAHRLGYPALTSKPLEEKRELVNDLLAQQSVLLVVDNFETVNDPNIAEFLVKVPPGTKVLLTSREVEKLLAPIFRRYPPARVHLGGLPDSEALMFLRQEARRRLGHLDEAKCFRLKAVIESNDDILLTLIRATRGNPKALELALGHIAEDATPLKKVVDDLYAASDSLADLFDHFFQSAWQRCGENAHALWQVIPFFTAPASQEALATVADLRGRHFYDALEELTGRSLLGVEEMPNAEPHYSVHPLVRAFAGARLNEVKHFEVEARQRWVKWCADFLAKHNKEDWPTFLVLDQEFENLTNVVTWALAEHHPDAPSLIKNYWYYLYIRGHWRLCEEITRKALSQATQQESSFLRLWLASHLGWLLSEKGKSEEATEWLHQVEQEILIMDQPMLLEETDVLNYLAQVYLWKDVERAIAYETRFLELARKADDLRSVLVAQYYLARASTIQKQYRSAVESFQNLFRMAQDIGWERAKGYCAYRLGRSLIDLQDYEGATKWLDHAGDMADYWHEPFLQANILFGRAQLQKAQQNFHEARLFAENALDLFKRLEAHTEIRQVLEFIEELN